MTNILKNLWNSIPIVTQDRVYRNTAIFRWDRRGHHFKPIDRTEQMKYIR